MERYLLSVGEKNRDLSRKREGLSHLRTLLTQGKGEDMKGGGRSLGGLNFLAAHGDMAGVSELGFK